MNWRPVDYRKVVKTFQYGRYWASKLELALYEILLFLERAKKIRHIECQVHVKFHTHEYGNTHMIPDFSAYDISLGRIVYYEAKGFETRTYLRKEKAWAINGPGLLHVYKGSWKAPKLAKIVTPKWMDEDGK